jgi:hypothetical protein
VTVDDVRLAERLRDAEPGIHLRAGADGSSIRVANKNGRERLVAP